MKLATTRPNLAAFDGRRVKAPAKTAATIYQSPEFRAWRETVITRAAGQCEAVNNGARCRKAQPRHRMFADHKIELTDGGAPFDPDNGQCLCGAHHSAKTFAARAGRR